MSARIHILGGYGGAGRALARLLIQQIPCELVISGRNLRKLEAFGRLLASEFPERPVHWRCIDVSSNKSLNEGLHDADIVIMAASAPTHAKKVAEVCISQGALYLDILVSAAVADQLSRIDPDKRKKALLITQGGFHPGMIAPLIRYAGKQLEVFDSAMVAMAMNARFDSPFSAIELIEDMADYHPKIVKGGEWEIATYRDAPRIDFGPPFGTKVCYPLEMIEIEPLQAKYKFRELGVYVAGFNWFVDYLVFPLSILLQKIKKGMGVRFCCWLLYHGIRWFSPKEELVHMIVRSSGTKQGLLINEEIRIESTDAYWLTAVPVIACIKQYQSGMLPDSGVHLMGIAVDEHALVRDMVEMGLQIQTKQEKGT